MGVCGPAARGASPHKQEAGLQGGPHTVLHSDHDPEVGGRGLWAQRASRSATTGNFSVRRSLGGAGPGDTAGGGRGEVGTGSARVGQSGFQTSRGSPEDSGFRNRPGREVPFASFPP